jgi:hypothetical protein
MNVLNRVPRSTIIAWIKNIYNAESYRRGPEDAFDEQWDWVQEEADTLEALANGRISYQEATLDPENYYGEDGELEDPRLPEVDGIPLEPSRLLCGGNRTGEWLFSQLLATVPPGRMFPRERARVVVSLRGNTLSVKDVLSTDELEDEEGFFWECRYSAVPMTYELEGY